ncbi:hypothetical protein ACKWTF_016792 [Chironomus riparius]
MSHLLSAEKVNLNINWLPEEILLHIFKYFGLNDIYNIALTSKRFSRIVDENFNILAPKMHRISLNCWNEYSEWVGVRKYSNFIIDSTAIIRFKDIISTRSDQITKLSLHFHNDPFIEIEVVREILIGLKNLKELRVNLINVIANNQNSLASLPNLKNLESLDFYGSSKFFNIFTNFQFKILKLRLYDPKENSEIFKNFLKKQKKLEDLKFYGYILPSVTPRPLFDDTDLDKVNFRLKNFKISRNPSFFIQTESFNKFLSYHQESLTYLSISQSEVNLDIVKNFKNLKKLKINRSYIMVDHVNSHVENVIIKRSSNRFLRNLINLKMLITIESASYLNELNFEDLKNLESLDIYASHIPRLVIPSVKNLKISNATSFDVDAFPLFQSNIQNLSLRNCVNIRSLLDYLNQPDTRLKSLKIEDSQIESKYLSGIKRNRLKIEVLEIIRCQRIADFPLWSYCVCEGYLNQFGMEPY